MENEALLRERKEKILGFLKSNYMLIVYVMLAVIVVISFGVRTSNVDKLKDITTNEWTLGPDLDPFLFLRWAEYIDENGSLYSVDGMRYVPLGFETKYELLLHPYMIAWFHKLFSVFSNESLTYSAIIYPVVMFSLGIIVFFLLVRKMFIDSFGKKKASIIAFISSLFLSVVPSILPRTIAGIPEKESSAFVFLFLSFYLFLCAWKSGSKKTKYIYALLSGLSTTAMALVWGGFIYIFITLAIAMTLSFLLGQVKKEEIYAYSIWLFSSFFLMNLFSTRFSYATLITSETTGIALTALFVCVVHFGIFSTKLEHYFDSGRLSKLPKQIISVIISVLIIFVLTSLFFGPTFLFSKISDVKQTLITPTVSRLGVTVAENKQPFFDEWKGSFGPVIFGKIPAFFWLFFFGSIMLFYHLVKPFEKKERIVLTSSYAFFLFAIIFSRYSSSGLLNGTNFISLLLYFAGFFVLAGVSGFYYCKYYKINKIGELKNIDFSLLVLFALFFLSIVSARGAVRLVMVLVPSASIIVSYFIVAMFDKALKTEEGVSRTISWILLALIVVGSIVSVYSFYKESRGTAEYYAPSVYTQQWQKAMSWVRENTPADAVFGHWWDYGYWLQSIGKRASVLDGGNAISYWNHLMGRYALTGTSSLEAAEFLYAHNTTNFLIDSTDIGKYSAYASIGSDASYDRNSWIPILVRDDSKTVERKNSSVFAYGGGISADEDIIYEQNGTRVFLPQGKAILAAVAVEISNDGQLVSNPIAFFIYQNQQYNVPLRYIYAGKLIDFGSGIDAGAYLMPAMSQGLDQIIQNGALIYLSPRTVNSQVARLYLYGQEDKYFKLVHTEDDLLVGQLKSQNVPNLGSIIYYQGLRGPIKIWEINYPSDIRFRKEFLDTKYPEEIKWA